MYNRIYNNLNYKGLLYKKQIGFQRNNPTKHVIFQPSRNITSSFEKGEYLLTDCIDLSKAFSSVDDQILIIKLQYYEIDGSVLE